MKYTVNHNVFYLLNSSVHSGVTPALSASSTGDISCLKALLTYNCDLTLRGLVYRQRWQLEVMVDSFEMAYMQGFLSLCLFMAQAGYSLYNKADIFQLDVLATRDKDWKPESPSNISYLRPQENNAKLTLTRAGHLEDDFRESLAKLVILSKSVKSLRDSAIIIIRRCVGCKILDDVEKLPLPRVIKNAVLLKDLLSS